MNIVVFALSEPNAIEAIKKLSEDEDINVCAWIGDDKGQGVLDYSYGRLLDMSSQQKESLLCPANIYQKVYQKMYIFLDMVYRNRHEAIYYYVNTFNLYINFYYGLFKKNNVEMLIFGDIPHFGCDSIAKTLADAMGIKTVMFQQAIEPNRVFAFLNVDDIGKFESLANDEQLNIELEEKHEKKLFYMSDLSLYNPHQTEESLIDIVKRSLNDMWCKRHDKGYAVYSFKQCIDKWVEGVFRDRWSLREFCRNSSRYTVSEAKVNLDCNFVYFPLHMQPEMTTSALGNEYCDQALAIERLRKVLPEDWKIYVKENPKQSQYMRDDMFFKRIRLSKNVELVDRKTDTYELMEKSKFVATITGTAGWEAISGGKNVLVFGLAWYRKLPGVFEFNDDFNYRDILSYKINHKELVEEYNKLMGKSYKGIIECGYEVDVEDYSVTRNNEYVYNILRKIINKINCDS